MKRSFIPCILILTAAVVLLSGYAWRLQIKVNALETEVRELNPIRVSNGVHILPPPKRQDVWRFSITTGALLSDPGLPERIKKSVEGLQQQARSNPLVSQ